MIPRLVQQITYWPIYLTLKVFFCFRVEGQENLKGLEDKPVIFVSNHASHLDSPICGAAMPRDGLFPKNFFPLRILAAKESFHWVKNIAPFPLSLLTAIYVRANGCIPVIRGLHNIQKNLEEAVKATKKNAKILIYPEGKKTRDGILQKGKKGVVYLHQTTNVVIVPIGLDGTYCASSRFLRFCRPQVIVRIGKPMHLPNGISLEDGTEMIMKEIEALVNGNAAASYTPLCAKEKTSSTV